MLYKEKGASGKTFDRPVFVEMMADAERGDFQVLVVYDVKRFGRNLGEGLKALNKLYDWGIEVRVEKMPWLDYRTSEGRRGWHNALTDAEYERDSYRDSSMRGMLKKASLGYHHGGHPPYGYENCDGQFEQVPVEARFVKKIWMLYAKYCTGPKVLAKLESNGPRYRPGVSTAAGQPTKRVMVTANWIDQIVRNPVYAGYVGSPGIEKIHGKLYAADYVDADGRMYFKGRQKAIVGVKLWRQVRAVIDSKPKDGRGKYVRNSPDYLLQGLVVCGCCDKLMLNAGGRGSSGRTYRYYVCSNVKIQRAHSDCSVRLVSGNALEQAVTRTLGQYASHPDLIASVVDASLHGSRAMQRDSKQEVAQLRKESAKVERDMTATLACVIKSKASKLRDDLAAEYDSMSARKKDIEQRLGIIASQIDAAERHTPSQEKVRRALERFNDLINNLSKVEAKELIHLLVKKVVLHKIDQKTNKRFRGIPAGSWLYRMEIFLSAAGVVVAASSLRAALQQDPSQRPGKSIGPVRVVFEIRRHGNAVSVNIIEPINLEANVETLAPPETLSEKDIEQHPLWLAEKMFEMVNTRQLTKTDIAKVYSKSCAWVTYHFNVLKVAPEIRNRVKAYRSPSILGRFGLTFLRNLGALSVEEQRQVFEREFDTALRAGSVADRGNKTA